MYSFYEWRTMLPHIHFSHFSFFPLQTQWGIRESYWVEQLWPWKRGGWWTRTTPKMALSTLKANLFLDPKVAVGKLAPLLLVTFFYPSLTFLLSLSSTNAQLFYYFKTFLTFHSTNHKPFNNSIMLTQAFTSMPLIWLLLFFSFLIVFPISKLWTTQLYHVMQFSATASVGDNWEEKFTCSIFCLCPSLRINLPTRGFPIFRCKWGFFLCFAGQRSDGVPAASVLA